MVGVFYASYHFQNHRFNIVDIENDRGFSYNNSTASKILNQETEFLEKVNVFNHTTVFILRDGNGNRFQQNLACKKLLADGVIEKMPLTAQVAAVSVGIFEDEAVLDLNYAEDSHAIVDCNVVMTSKGEFIEVQGTGEGRPFTDTELRKLLGLGKRGCLTLCRKQAKVMGESL